MEFTYDGAGNRVSKNVGTIDASNNITYTDKTTYIRDASGNIMATYDDRQVGTLWAQSAEYPIYGSSRLGVYNQSIYDPLQSTNVDDPSWLGSYQRMMRLKNYELSDHLGNVLTVISDWKIGVSNTGNTGLQYYKADVQSAIDYYPFGMQMPGRIYNGGEYRYGFNGQEKIDEIAGVGNHLDFKFRGYDPETGRFWSVDPLAKKFVFNSPYAFAENKLGLGKEYEGLELISPIFGANIEPMIEVVGESEVAGNVGKIGVDINKVGGDLDGGVTETPKVEWHHKIPGQLKNNEVVKGAREEGFEFEGKENKMEVEKYSKQTGDGQHGNHPKYNDEVLRRLDEFSQKNPKATNEQKLQFLRNTAKDLEQTIRANPTKKVNDLFVRQPVIPLITPVPSGAAPSAPIPANGKFVLPAIALPRDNTRVKTPVEPILAPKPVCTTCA